jgi:ribosomal-protein-alanine N-acetyltransferase
MSKLSGAGSSLCYSIEPMLTQHMNDVLKIERSSYSFPWTQAMFESSLTSRDECRVLRAEGYIVGYSIVSYILDEAHILNLCVHPDYVGLGFGRLLLKQIIQNAIEKSCQMLFLEVRVSNTPAINLYFSEGFNEVGLRPNYYPSERGKEDAMLMTLDLSVDLYA